MRILAADGLLLFLYTVVAMRNGGGFDSDYYTVGDLVSNPSRTCAIVYNTISQMGGEWMMQAIGTRFGWIEISTPAILMIIWVIVLVFASLPGKDAGRRDGMEEFFLHAVLFATCGFVVGGMLVGWTPKTSLVVGGVQGRYFIPILPIACYLLGCRKSYSDEGLDKEVFGWALGLHLCLLIWLLNRFYES